MNAALGVERSFSGRSWFFRESDPDAVQALARAANISPVLAQILAARGIGAPDVTDYLHPTLKRQLPEPNRLMNMEAAVARAHQAIERGETIAVFGDYDVDGSCAAALLREFFRAAGCNPLVYIPDRLTEGYGPSHGALAQLRARGATLLITVDCGATASAVLDEAHANGLNAVVLDHHALEEPWAGRAIQINPNQPGDTSGLNCLCAAGVAFLFAVALNRALRESGWYSSQHILEPDLRASVDLAGLATVCDVVPLQGVNRAFVAAALARCASRPRPGLKALAEIAKASPPFSPHHFGFVLGPRINAGGRVGRCSLGVELLGVDNDSEAASLAAQLDLHNCERRAIEAGMLETAMVQAAEQNGASFVWAAGEDWHPGVLGIIAGRLKERFGKPAIAVGIGTDGTARASARSVAGIDIGVIVREARAVNILENGGGHAMAAGFSLASSRCEAMREFLTARLLGKDDALAAASILDIHGVVSAAGVTQSLAEDIGSAGPFGAGNPEPVLAAPDVELAWADETAGGHLRLRLRGRDGSGLNAVAFRAIDSPLGQGLLAARGKRIHAAGSLKLDRYNGAVRVEMQMTDAAPASL